MGIVSRFSASSTSHDNETPSGQRQAVNDRVHTSRSSLNSMESDLSYQSGKFSGKGIFRPGMNAQYNFMIQRFKHKKDIKAEETHFSTQLKEIERSSRKGSRNGVQEYLARQ